MRSCKEKISNTNKDNNDVLAWNDSCVSVLARNRPDKEIREIKEKWGAF